MRSVFMGTPAFAMPCFDALCNLTNVVAVYTRQDRPAGRGRKLEEAPIKRAATAKGIIVSTPKSLRTIGALDELRSLAPDLIVVAAYGLILPPSILALPKHGCINVHASLLPRHRGASPIAAAILSGDSQTGITLMKMDAGLDTGPIIAQRSVQIAGEDSTETLEATLSLVGAELLRDTLPAWLTGEVRAIPQDDERATVTRLLRKEDGLIDWTKSADHIARMIRAYTPWPGASTPWNEQSLRIVKAHSVPKQLPIGRVGGDGQGVCVGTGDGSLWLDTVQLAGKRPMSANDFARGHRNFLGSTLGGGA